MLWWSSIYIINKHTPFFPLLHLFLYFLFISFFFPLHFSPFLSFLHLNSLMECETIFILASWHPLIHQPFSIETSARCIFSLFVSRWILEWELMNLCLSNQNLILTVHMYKYCITIPLHLTCIVKNYIGIFRHGCIVNNFRYNVIFVNSIVEY